MTEPVRVENVKPPQPRRDGGRFGEKPDVGLSRRLTQRLREALGHDGGDPTEDDDMDGRIASQQALLDDDLGDLDARLVEQELVGAEKNLLTSLATAAVQEEVHAPDEPVDEPVDEPILLDEKILAARMSAQAGLLDRVSDPMETDEAKIRKWDPDLHPRDHNGRFATIGSLVSFGSGESGRIVGNARGGKVQVEKPDGTRVTVPSKDTTVTTSAAAAAVLESRPKTPGSTAPAPLKGDVPDRGPAQVQKPSADQPRALIPAPSEAERNTAMMEQHQAYLEGTGMSPADAAEQAKGDMGKMGAEMRGGLSDRMVAAHRADPKGAVAAARAQGEADGPEGPGLLARIRSMLPGGDKAPTRAPEPASDIVSAPPAPDADARARAKADAARDRFTGMSNEQLAADIADLKEKQDLGVHPLSPTTDTRLRQMEAEQARRAKSPDDYSHMTDDALTADIADLKEKQDLGVHPLSQTTGARLRHMEAEQARRQAIPKAPAPTAEFGTHAPGTKPEAADNPTGAFDPALGEGNQPNDGLFDAQGRYLGKPKDPKADRPPMGVEDSYATDTSGRIGSPVADKTDVEIEAGIASLEGQDPAKLGPTNTARLEELKAEQARRGGSKGTGDLSDEEITAEINGLIQSWTEQDGSFTDEQRTRMRELDTEQADRRRPDRAGSDVVNAPPPIGGQPTDEPGTTTGGDDAINRSLWTGGVPPNGQDGSGTRADGKPYGTGYDPGDPREDPAYDQYLEDVDARIEEMMARIGDTETIHDKVDGVPKKYREERAAQHAAIVDEIMAGYAHIPREGKAVVLAGPPGSGKSTVLKRKGGEFGLEMTEGTPLGGALQGTEPIPANYAVVNPDEFKALMIQRGMLPEYDGQGLGPEETATFIHEESTAISDLLRDRLAAEGVNLVLDGTFAGKPDRQASKVSQLRNEGYSVTGVLVDGDVDTSQLRAAGRHRKPPAEPGGPYQGRYVQPWLIDTNRPPEETMSSTFGRPHKSRSSINMEKFQEMFDGGVLYYDNSGPNGTELVHSTVPTAKSPADSVRALESQIARVDDPKIQEALQAQLDDLRATLGIKALDADLETKAEGGADRNRGGAERLRAYWVHGEGAAKIGWGTSGDFMRCVTLVSEHMDPERAKGYCNLRHHDATGAAPGHAPGEGKTLADFGLTLNNAFLETKADTAETVVPQQESTEPLPNENPVSTGVMVALYPPDAVAHALAYPGGEDRTELHVTLAYLGKVDEVPDVDTLKALVEDFANDSYDVDGEVSGLGRFSGEADGDPFYASVDCPELPDFRTDLIEALKAAGYTPRTDHGFTPHITLGYLQPDDPMPLERLDAMPCTFGFLSLAYGDDVWDFPLTDNEAAGDGAEMEPDDAAGVIVEPEVVES